MTGNGQQSELDLDLIKADVAKLRADLGDILGQLVDDGKTKTGALKGKVADAGKRGLEFAEKTIKQRPLISILVVFLLGLLLGKMIDAKLRG